MLIGFLCGLLALLLAVVAVVCHAHEKSMPCFGCGVFAVAVMGMGVWMAYDSALGLPRSKFDLKIGETYEATDGFVFNQQLYEGLVPQSGGEMRLYRFNESTPPRFVAQKTDGVGVELRRVPRK